MGACDASWWCFRSFAGASLTRYVVLKAMTTVVSRQPSSARQIDLLYLSIYLSISARHRSRFPTSVRWCCPARTGKGS